MPHYLKCTRRSIPEGTLRLYSVTQRLVPAKFRFRFPAFQLAFVSAAFGIRVPKLIADGAADGSTHHVRRFPVVLPHLLGGAGWSRVLLCDPRNAQRRRFTGGVQESPPGQVLLRPGLLQRQSHTSQVLRRSRGETFESSPCRLRRGPHVLVFARYQGLSHQGLLFGGQLRGSILFRPTFARRDKGRSSACVLVRKMPGRRDVDPEPVARRAQ